MNLRKDLRHLVAPIFIETLLTFTLMAVDSFMLSRYSDNAVAAVGMVSQILSLVFLLFTIINSGTSVLCSQYIGSGEKRRFVQVAGVALALNLLVGIVVSIACIGLAPEIIGFMELREELTPYGIRYLQIVGGFAGVQAVTTTISAILRAADKAKYPMYVIAVVNVLNIFGNYALIFGKFGFPALGVEGAAISTSFSRVVAMILLIIVLQQKLIPRFALRWFRPFPFREVRNLLHIGLPSAGENISYNAQQLTLLYFVNMLGNDALAARTYCVNILMFVYLFTICMAQGGSILIGHLIGMGKVRATFLTGRYVWRWSVYVSMSLSLLTALCGYWIMSALTDNPEIIRLGQLVLWVDVLLEAGKAVNIFATNALRATGDVMFPFYLGIIVQWAVGVLFGYIFGISLAWGLVGMWFAFVFDENIRGTIFIRRWNSLRWAGKSFAKS